MKSTIAALACVVLATAAGCADNNKPAQDPSASATTTGSADKSSTASMANSANPPASDSMGTSQTAPVYQDPSSTSSAMRGTTTGTTGSGSNRAMTGSSTTGTSPDTSTMTPPPATTPAPNADGTKNADNTKLNERDRKSTLTPINQGNSSAETKITADIRKAILAKKLSFNAANSKVITTGTKVTLRGPVKSDEEKATIESIAKATAGVTEVDNQLEVKK